MKVWRAPPSESVVFFALAVYNRRMIQLAMARKRNRLATILLVLLLMVMLASSVFIVTHAEHNCTGVGCHTCQELLICDWILGGVGFAAALALFSGVSRSGAGASAARGSGAPTM
jgi:undecaprenyl pyrophosphate phosphatase UppP